MLILWFPVDIIGLVTNTNINQWSGREAGDKTSQINFLDKLTILVNEITCCSHYNNIVVIAIILHR
ncbi:hypothetical protein [Gracilibacillus xinjiangensis]|uniref:Uncharacterized protein n=1 Tax=Gracilibacillus xinjiangensis TaxID=1193282 RepID=A0ABV8WRP7_9BACI